MRQAEDSQFFDILEKIRLGQDLSDVHRFFDCSGRVKNEVADGSMLILAPTNAVCKEYNNQRLMSCNKAIAILGSGTERNFQKESLERELILGEGIDVMLRTNLCVEAGLVNGARGKVKAFLGEHILSIKIILVKFEAIKPEFEEGFHEGLIPIETVSVRSKGSVIKQFPLTPATAITIHKSQGLSLDRAFVSLGARETIGGLTYVALSRVKTLQGLSISPHYFSQRRMESIAQTQHIEELVRYEQLLSEQEAFDMNT